MSEIRIACSSKDYLNYKDIKPFQGELKSLSKENFEKLKKQILETGFAFPILVWKNPEDNLVYTLGGHQRLRTIGQLVEREGYICPDLPVVYVEAADKKAAKKRILQDISQFGHVEQEGLYEFAQLAEISLDELKGFDFPDLDLEKFESSFYDATEPVEGEDEVPSNVPAQAKAGDLYRLGEHRLLCGDSTSKLDVERLMNGEKADMVFTDPPYGVNYEGGHNEKKRDGIENDKLEGFDLTELFHKSLKCAEASTHNHAAFYIWYASGKSVETYAAFSKLSLQVRAVLTWYKVRSGLGAFMAQYIPNYEPCIYAFKKDQSPQWFGASDEKTVWEQQRIGINEYHPTQKPVELADRAIKNSSKSGDIVLDLFGGSGATLIACEKAKRKCYMMELDPHYCDVIVARWEQFTGKKAEIIK